MNESLILAQAVALAWPDMPSADVAAIEPELLSALRELEAAPSADLAPIRDRIIDVVSRAPALADRLRREELSMRVASTRGHEGLPAPLTRRSEVTVLYATDRALSGEIDQRRHFGASRGERIRYGTARVELPDDQRMGRLPAPRHWSLRFGRPRSFRFLLEEADGLNGPLSVQRYRAPGPDILLFVHGYNVSFVDAVRRTAQLAYDLDFSGVPVAYSWPSEDATLSYLIDGENAAASQRNFRQVLIELSNSAKVHIIAHSMGNRILSEALSALDAFDLGHVVFAAPDVDTQVFVDRVREFTGHAERYTLYVSDRDRALRTSMRLAKYPRAGSAGANVVVMDGIDTIDASDLDTGFLSHSYAMEHRSVIADIYALLRHNQPPGDRFGMRPVMSPRGQYWVFKR